MALANTPLMPSTPEDRKIIDFQNATAEDAVQALPETERQLFLQMLAAQKEKDELVRSNQLLVADIIEGRYKQDTTSEK